MLKLATFAFHIFVFSSPSAICTYTPTVTEAVARSDVVFVGKVVARRKFDVKFEVQRSWKGTGGRYVYVFTGNMRNDAIPQFAKDEEWLVYAKRKAVYVSESKETKESLRLMADVCNRTALLQNSTEDLQKLGPPRKSFK